GAHAGSEVAAHMPPRLAWTTEGKTFVAELGPQPPRRLRCRTFWYVHANGALSYSMSFSLNYTHAIDDFFFISLLQKAAAPKEFAPEHPFLADGAPRDIRVTQPHAGLAPFDGLQIEAGGALQPIWHFIARQFDIDAADLLAHAALHAPRAVDGKRL